MSFLFLFHFSHICLHVDIPSVSNIIPFILQFLLRNAFLSDFWAYCTFWMFWFFQMKKMFKNSKMSVFDFFFQQENQFFSTILPESSLFGSQSRNLSRSPSVSSQEGGGPTHPPCWQGGPDPSHASLAPPTRPPGGLRAGFGKHHFNLPIRNQ